MSYDITTDIKTHIDAKELFRRHYPQHFKAYGNSLCPFHNDTNSSLSFRNGSFKCFADHCDAHGDVIDLYQRIHGCDFREALKGLMAEAGIGSEKGPRKVATEEPLLTQAEEKQRPD